MLLCRHQKTKVLKHYIIQQGHKVTPGELQWAVLGPVCHQSSTCSTIPLYDKMIYLEKRGTRGFKEFLSFLFSSDKSFGLVLFLVLMFAPREFGVDLMGCLYTKQLHSPPQSWLCNNFLPAKPHLGFGRGCEREDREMEAGEKLVRKDG